MKYPDSEGTIIFDLNNEKKIDKKFKLKFSIMYRDRVASDFYYCDEEKRILVVNYTERICELGFGGGVVTPQRVYEYFQSRTIDQARPDLKEYLARLGLTEYNPYKMVRETHGLMWDDYQWVRFPDDTVTYEEIKIRD